MRLTRCFFNSASPELPLNPSQGNPQVRPPAPTIYTTTIYSLLCLISLHPSFHVNVLQLLITFQWKLLFYECKTSYAMT